MYKEIIIELCIPADEARERLRRAAKLSFWSERQRADLHIGRDAVWSCVGNEILLQQVPSSLSARSTHIWTLSGHIQDAEKGCCRIGGAFYTEYERTRLPLVPIASAALILLLWEIVGGAPWFLRVGFGAVLVLWLTVRRTLDRRAERHCQAIFAAFLNVVFQGALVRVDCPGEEEPNQSE